jgi:hypothetical protein
MGFEPEATHYKLKFEEPSLAGLEVTVAGLSIGEFEDLTALADEAGIRQADPQSMAPGDVKAATAGVLKLLGVFAESLVEWNVTRKGEPVAADLAGVKSQELGFVFRIITEWMTAIAGVDPTSQPGSKPGPDPEAELDLAATSQSLPS